MDEMKLGQRTHRSAPVTMILMDMVRKGEKIKSGLVQVWVFRAKQATDSDRKYKGRTKRETLKRRLKTVTPCDRLLRMAKG
jgi:hypothetical protein